MNISPLAIAIPDATLADLDRRLTRVRWPDEVEDAGWDYGASLAFMRDIVEYWRTHFDWRAQEQAINRFANFRANVDGHRIHFVHERGKGPRPLPLLLTHGWPSSFYEMLELVSLLTDPAAHGGDADDAFDVVVPSVPGYGFSGKPARRGFGYRQIAGLWKRLMEGLGYDRFGAHAYDIGASIMSHLLLDRPDRLIGYHTTEPANPAPYIDEDASPLSTAEREYLAFQQAWEGDEGGYMALQTTRPQTLGYALNDSPIGLAAWILEKWRAWTLPSDGDLLEHFTRDQLLTNVTIYWGTKTINSANRLYYERAHSPRQRLPSDRVSVPTGVALTTQSIELAPREFASRMFTDIRQWVELGRGGHFVALEEPALLASAIRAFFRPLR